MSGVDLPTLLAEAEALPALAAPPAAAAGPDPRDAALAHAIAAEMVARPREWAGFAVRAGRALASLADRGAFARGSAARVLLWRAVFGPTALARWTPDQAFPPSPREGDEPLQDMVLALPDVSTDEIAALYGVLQDDSWGHHTARVVRHPACSLRLLRGILSRNRVELKLRVWVAAAERPDVQADPDLAARLLQAQATLDATGQADERGPHWALRLARAIGAPPVAFAASFRDYAARAPDAAARMLRKATPAQLAALTRADVLPLLRRGDTAARLTAQRALHRLCVDAPEASGAPESLTGPAAIPAATTTLGGTSRTR